MISQSSWLATSYRQFMNSCKRRGVVVWLRASERKLCSLKLYRNTAGICQEGHPEFKSLVRKRVCSGRHTLNQHA